MNETISMGIVIFMLMLALMFVRLMWWLREVMDAIRKIHQANIRDIDAGRPYENNRWKAFDEINDNRAIFSFWRHPASFYPPSLWEPRKD